MEPGEREATVHRGAIADQTRVLRISPSVRLHRDKHSHSCVSPTTMRRAPKMQTAKCRAQERSGHDTPSPSTKSYRVQKRFTALRVPFCVGEAAHGVAPAHLRRGYLIAAAARAVGTRCASNTRVSVTSVSLPLVSP